MSKLTIDFNKQALIGSLSEKREPIKRLSAHFKLTTIDLQKALGSEVIFINGNYYHVPKSQLVDYRADGIYPLTLTQLSEEELKDLTSE